MNCERRFKIRHPVVRYVEIEGGKGDLLTQIRMARLRKDHVASGYPKVKDVTLSACLAHSGARLRKAACKISAVDVPL
uniref:Uncharacterized protein n=1 Tax=Peronospora matthiolae TaxID=2874970 RepID=A0AAV1TSJ0_9STRA